MWGAGPELGRQEATAIVQVSRDETGLQGKRDQVLCCVHVLPSSHFEPLAPPVTCALFLLSTALYVLAGGLELLICSCSEGWRWGGIGNNNMWPPFSTFILFPLSTPTILSLKCV